MTRHRFSDRLIRICSPSLIGLGVALFAATAPLPRAQAQQAPDDHLIVPAKRIGPVALGMSADDVVGILGKPVSIWPGEVDTYNWHGIFATITKNGSWVTQICATNPVYATAAGLHAGSTDREITAVLGRPTYSRVFGIWWRLSFTNLYWPGLMISVHLKGYEDDHSAWKICVNHFAGSAE